MNGTSGAVEGGTVSDRNGRGGMLPSTEVTGGNMAGSAHHHGLLFPIEVGRDEKRRKSPDGIATTDVILSACTWRRKLDGYARESLDTSDGLE